MLNKSTRPKLKLSLQVHELSSIPLVTGQVFVKWHILHSSSGECRGKTEVAPIIDHKAVWGNYKHECTFKVGIGKDGVLQERILIMEVWLEMISGRERLRIGNLAINLSEYASVKSETRRYLLQDSKMNSTVKLTISVVHVEGSRDYTTPPLKKAQMFHGITNLLAENKDSLPRISRELEQYNPKHMLYSPTQETYRRTFAAQCRLHGDELPPRDVVESIFKGGSGWKIEDPPAIIRSPERKTPHIRTESRGLSRPVRAPAGQSSLRFTKITHLSMTRSITPSSADDDQSDYEERDDMGEWLRVEPNSHRQGHVRTDSMVTLSPLRRRPRSRQQTNIVTREEWEKEELASGHTSWTTPNLDAIEEKIEKRRIARSTNGSSIGSAPGSSGKLSSMARSSSTNGSVISQSIVEAGVERENGANTADDSENSEVMEVWS